MNLPAYPRYKPSGAEWIGDLPEHWDTLQFGGMPAYSNRRYASDGRRSLLRRRNSSLVWPRILR